MSNLVVTGYAGLDYVMTLSGEIAPDRTTHASRDAGSWPRPGGCPSYISLAAASAGAKVSPVMWLGSDADADMLINHLKSKGVGTHAIAQICGARSPAAVMTYDPSGACSCLYDPGMAGQEALTQPLQDAIAGASHLCISVGPGHLTEQILDLRSPDARLYWALKDDPASFDPGLCKRLSKAADVIFCSAIERHLIEPCDAVILQTQGAQGVRVEAGGTSIYLPVAPIEVTDTTGAGDTFAGGYIAAEMAGETSPQQAAHAGIAAAAQLLRQRVGEDA